MKRKQTEDPVLSFALSKQPDLLEALSVLVACPSVGADPEMAQGMEDARNLVEARVEAMGFRNLQRLTSHEVPGQPAIYADRLDAPGKPTLLVYAHYDVQPPDPIDKWNSPPFELTKKNSRLYGRGVSDDKAPMLIALDALAAFVAVEGAPPVNTKLLIEGEEETGSPSLPALLETHKELLAADAVLSADGARWRPDIVTLNIGSRGNAGFELRVRTASQDLHSGRYGGIVPNALHELSRIIAGLHDDQGRIAAPGFYDGVLAPTNAEREEIVSIPFDEESAFETFATVACGEHGFSTLERLWLRPTLDVNGMWGGYTGSGSKTVIPNEAFAKLTMRLVPGQDPDAVQIAIVAHLKSQLREGTSLDIYDVRGSSRAYAVPTEHPLLKAAEKALEFTTGHVPLKVRIGASLPLTEMVNTILGLDTIMFSFAISDENFHAPNEFFRLDSISEGLAAWIRILREVAMSDADVFAPYKTA